MAIVSRFSHNGVAAIGSILAVNGLDPASPELEITKTALLKDRSATRGVLRQIKASDVKTVMQDFDTGGSSLNSLLSFPFDRLKTDQSFIAGIDNDANDRAIIPAVVSLSLNLGLPVTEQGIETQAQYRFVVDEGCAHAQGYLFNNRVAVP